MKLCIRYYTGTGNTARAAALAAGEFTAAGWTVDSRAVTRGMEDPYGGLGGADLLLVAFSALGFSPSATMMAWLKGIPGGTGGRAAVLCVCGSEFGRGGYQPGWSGDAVFAAARTLARRFWPTAGVAEASYPVNWVQMVDTPPEDRLEELLSRGDAAVRDFAAALAAGKAPAALAETAGRRWMGVIGVAFRLFGRRALGSLFASDPACTSCGLCARSCPAQAIRMEDGAPAWTGRCDSCNRCVNICPVGAIRSSGILLWTHASLAVGLGVLAAVLPLPWAAAGLPRTLMRVDLFLLGPILQFALVAPLLSALGRTRGFRRAFASSFMQAYRRYREPGFRP